MTYELVELIVSVTIDDLIESGYRFCGDLFHWGNRMFKREGKR